MVAEGESGENGGTRGRAVHQSLPRLDFLSAPFRKGLASPALKHTLEHTL